MYIYNNKTEYQTFFISIPYVMALLNFNLIRYFFLKLVIDVSEDTNNKQQISIKC